MSLWRNPDFVKLWVGQTISEIGTRVSREGIPLTAVLVLHATPAQMGLLTAMGAAVALVASPMAGAMADRMRRRPLMIAADVGRALVLVTIPIAHSNGLLSLSHLLIAVAAAGILSVLFDVAYPTYSPGLVGREQILEANSKLALTMSVAEVTGPALTGVLVKVLTAPVAILADAISFLVSAVSIATIRKPEAAPEPPAAREGVWTEASAGFRFVFRHALLRPIALRTATVSFAWGFFSTLYVLYAIEYLKMSTVTMGIVITLGGVGNLAGAVLAQRVVAKLRLGRVLVGATVWQGLMALLLPAASEPGWVSVALLGASQLFGDVAYPLYNINELTLRQRASPPELLGRVNACLQLLFKALLPLGALVGGALASAAGPRLALLVSALLILASSLWLVFSPLPQLADHGEYTR